MKKIVSLLLCLVLVASLCISAFAEEITATGKAVSLLPNVTRLGDISGNGEHDILDYIMAKRIVLGTFTPTEKQRLSADIDGNGDISVVDYIKIKRSVIGNYHITYAVPVENEEVIGRLKKAYYNSLDDSIKSHDSVDDITAGGLIYGYGVNNDLFCGVFSSVNWVYPCVEETIRLGNHIISKGLSPLISDGERFYGLTEAYRLGILTETDVEDLSARYPATDSSPYAYYEHDGEVERVYIGYEAEADRLVSPYKMSEDKIEKLIRQTYSDRTSGVIKPENLSYELCGIYGDAYAVLVYSDSYFKYHLRRTIDGKLFIFPTDEQMSVYANGELLTLEEAFDNGILSSHDITRLYYRYRASHRELYAWEELEPLPELEPLDDEMLEILDTDQSGYYGTYNGYIVHMSATPMTAIGYIEIAGETFVWGTLFHLNAYKDGKFETLAEVYDAGGISKDDITTIARRHEAHRQKTHNW